MKTISLNETKKALVKILEIPGNGWAVAEIANEEGGIRLEFKFNMRGVVSNPTFFKNAAGALERFGAVISLEPKVAGPDGPWIELTASMKVGGITP